MTAQTKTVIKSYFETGDKPTQAQFADMIDSYVDNNLIDVFLIGGQSNAQGFSITATTSPSVPSSSVLQYYNSTISTANDPVGNANGGSAWPSFGVVYNAATGRKICFVPAAVGGSSQCAAADIGNGNWDTTGALYTTSITLLNAAIAALTAAAYTPVFRGVLWCQGETDALAIKASTITQATYKAALIAMIARYRATTINGTSYPQIRVAQGQVASADLHTKIAFSNAVDFPDLGLSQSTVHYTQDGYNMMGERMASAVISDPMLNFYIPTTSWTPTFTTDGTVGTPAYSFQSGDYIKIGNMVTARFGLILSSWAGSPTGNVLIGGLPFSPATTLGAGIFSKVDKINYGSASYTQLGLIPVAGARILNIFAFGSGSGVTSSFVPVSGVATTAGVFGQITYFT